MNAGTLPILAALAASLLLLVRTRARLWPATATAASGLMTLFALGLVSFAVKGVPLGLVLAATLTVAGVMSWLGAGGKLPEVWLYRGAWQEWPITDATWLVPMSQEELRLKIQAIFKHQSQKDSAPFPGQDEREFWQRVEDRNRGTALTLAKRRWRGTAIDGAEFGFDLVHPLANGDVFAETETAVYRIAQQPEPVLEIPLESDPAAAARCARRRGRTVC